MIVRGPMIPPALRGTSLPTPVANVDLVPTILDYAGVEPLRPVDGVPLAPMLEQGHQTEWEDRLIYLVGVRGGGCRCGYTYSGVRTGDGWVYWRRDAGLRRAELYDLDTDPHQLQNLADDPEAALVQARLELARSHLLSCAEASCGRPGNWAPWEADLPPP
jgi:choline-sulfatase